MEQVCFRHVDHGGTFHEAVHGRTGNQPSAFAAVAEQQFPDAGHALFDGGQTGELVFNGQIYNRIDFDAERTVSDILYFASAVGDSGGKSQ